MQISSSNVVSPKLPKQFRLKDSKISNIQQVQKQDKEYSHEQKKFFNQSIQIKSFLNFGDTGTIGQQESQFQVTFPSDFMCEEEFLVQMQSGQSNLIQDDVSQDKRSIKSLSKRNVSRDQQTSGGSLSLFNSRNRIQEISFQAVKRGLNTFPKMYTFQDEYLEILDLSSNKFREIPKEIFRFRNLKSLKMESNFIKEIPEILFTCLNLEILSFYNNLITYIPETLGKQKQLKFLDISLNRITNICNFGLGGLKELNTLILNNNEFRYIPTTLFQLENLVFFCLDWFKYAQPSMEIKVHEKALIKQVLDLCKKDHLRQTKRGQKELEENQNLQEDVFFHEPGLYFIDFVTHFSQKNEFDIQIQNNEKKNCLAHFASQDEDLGPLQCILEEDYQQINMVNLDNHTPLSLSIINEKYFASRMLIALGANVNIGGGAYGSCLNLSMIKFQSFQVQDLLKRGANPNQKDKDGNISLHYLMTIYGRDPSFAEKICQLLLKNGADPNSRNHEGWTPILIATRKGCFEAVQFIIDYNRQLKKTPGNMYKLFQINKKGGRDHNTPLHIAAADSCIEILEILLKSGECDIFSQNKAGKYAIDLTMRDCYIYKILKIYWDMAMGLYFEQDFKIQKKEFSQRVKSLHFKDENQLGITNNFSGEQQTQRSNLNDSFSVKRTQIIAKGGYFSVENSEILENEMEDQYFQHQDLDEFKLNEEKDLNLFNIASRSLNYGQNNLKQIENYFYSSMKKPLQVKNDLNVIKQINQINQLSINSNISTMANNSSLLSQQKNLPKNKNFIKQQQISSTNQLNSLTESDSGKNKGKNEIHELHQQQKLMTYQDFCKLKHQLCKFEQMVNNYIFNKRTLVSNINNHHETVPEKIKFLNFLFKIQFEISFNFLTLNKDKDKILEFNLDLYDKDMLQFEEQFSNYNQQINSFYLDLITIIEFHLNILSEKNLSQTTMFGINQTSHNTRFQESTILEQIIYFLGFEEQQNSIDQLRNLFQQQIPLFIQFEIFQSVQIIKNKLQQIKTFNQNQQNYEKIKVIHFISEPDIENYSIKSGQDEDEMANSFQSFKTFQSASVNSKQIISKNQLSFKKDYQPTGEIVYEENDFFLKEDEMISKSINYNESDKKLNQEKIF